MFELCDIAEPDKTTRPYKTIWDLKKLRDMIAHAKPEVFAENIIHEKSDEARLWRREMLDGLVTHEGACQGVDDTREFIYLVHNAAKKTMPIFTLQEIP